VYSEQILQNFPTLYGTQRFIIVSTFPKPNQSNPHVLEIVIHQDIRLSTVIVSDIQDSDNLPTVFQILDHGKTKHL
jgi:hypothetical protein